MNFLNFKLIIFCLFIFIGCTTTRRPTESQLKTFDKSNSDLFYFFEQFPNHFYEPRVSDQISISTVDEINKIDEKTGNTILHLAFYNIEYHGLKEITNQLLDKGADVDFRNKTGNSFLMLILSYSKYTNFQPLIRKTLSKSKDIDQKNQEGKTCYQILEQYKNYTGIQELMDYIKTELHLSVADLKCTGLVNNEVTYTISFNHKIYGASNVSDFLRVVDSKNNSSGFDVNQLSDSQIELKLIDFNLSGKYFLQISKGLKSTDGRTLIDEYKTPLIFSSIFKDVDIYARSTPEMQEQTIESLSWYLTSPFTDNLSKIRSVYVWITDRISYDVEGYFNNSIGDLSPEMVLKTRKSVCQGYSNLFTKLCLLSGIECKTISGFGKGAGYTVGQKIGQQTNHAWNVVNLMGRWYFIEATWGSGYLDYKEFKKEFSDYFFLTPPEYFITSHFPEETKWQLLDNPITIEEFESIIDQDEAGKFGIQVISPKNAIIQHEGSAQIQLEVPDNIDLLINCVGNYEISRKSNLWTISLADLPKDESKVNIFAREISQKSNIYHGILEYKLVRNPNCKPINSVILRNINFS